ncbi:MAG: hypothetical protein HY581_04980 [Nitrospirae bacterium]|nr:hypothetical protein [Nitrospirota bacterium]
MAPPSSSLPTVKKDTAPATVLTTEQIEAVVNALPVQGRIMLRLLLLQYLDVTQEDIEFVAADRPDPRFHSGGKPATPYISQETIQGISDRVAQYRTQVRQKRERTWLQIECLQKQIALTESLCTLVERLLTTRFGMNDGAVKELKQGARTAVPKLAIRELDRRWEKDEITEEDYRKERLGIEYQRLLKKLERERKRLETAKREFAVAGDVPLQDHEIAHIWGIPAGSLAARKAKYLIQYLQGIQAILQTPRPATEQATTPPVDLWKETFAVLSRKPVQRSVAAYDGQEGTEAALIDKLMAFAAGTFPEENETRFWLSLVQEISHATEYGSKLKSLFALQRLSTILAEMDTSPDVLEQDLLLRVSPKPKAVAIESAQETKGTEPQLGEMGEHVLKSFMGEQHPDLHGRR